MINAMIIQNPSVGLAAKVDASIGLVLSLVYSFSCVSHANHHHSHHHHHWC